MSVRRGPIYAGASRKDTNRRFAMRSDSLLPASLSISNEFLRRCRPSAIFLRLSAVGVAAVSLLVF